LNWHQDASVVLRETSLIWPFIFRMIKTIKWRSRELGSPLETIYKWHLLIELTTLKYSFSCGATPDFTHNFKCTTTNMSMIFHDALYHYLIIQLSKYLLETSLIWPLILSSLTADIYIYLFQTRLNSVPKKMRRNVTLYQGFKPWI
jgi:hypothetical protein